MSVEPACIGQISGGAFRDAADNEIRHREPCTFCFPDGDVDLPVEQCVVPSGVRLGRGKVHARKGVREIELPESEMPDETVAGLLNDVNPDDDWETIVGGGSDA